jgi:hypothetical protein
MSEFVFNNYIWFSCSVISVSFITLVLGIAFTNNESRLKKSVKSGLVFISLIVLGMSSDIKNINYIGILHSVIAFTIAFYAVKSFGNKVAYCFWVPCLLMLVVIIFNYFNNGVGLELFGRWGVFL